MTEFTHVPHRGHSFTRGFLLPAADPRLSIVVQPDGDTFIFARVPGSQVVTGGPRVALGWAEEAGITIPDTFLQSRDGRQYAPKPKSHWRAIEPGEERRVPMKDVLNRLWPQVRGLTLSVEGDEVVVKYE